MTARRFNRVRARRNEARRARRTSERFAWFALLPGVLLGFAAIFFVARFLASFVPP